jgi:hypothetical protein
MSQGFTERHCKPLKHNENACNKLRHEKGLSWKAKPLISLVPGEGLEPPTNGLQNRCSTTELTRRYWVSYTPPLKLPPDCHRKVRSSCLVRSLTREHLFHKFRRLRIRVSEQMAVNRQCDCGRAVAEAATDRERVHTRSD